MLTTNLQRDTIRLLNDNQQGGEHMTNTLEFEIALKRSKLSKRDVATKLNLSLMGLYKKMNNITEFKASELAALYELLNLKTFEDQQKIFFAQNVDE